jgi:hypothetical protein
LISRKTDGAWPGLPLANWIAVAIVFFCQLIKSMISSEPKARLASADRAVRDFSLHDAMNSLWVLITYLFLVLGMHTGSPSLK